jgi:hypothetical protein
MDCHTPGYFFGMPDMSRMLGGSEVGFEIPGLGVFHGPNLTPDPETGLGNWTKADRLAFTTATPRRQKLAIMPWRLRQPHAADAMAVVYPQEPAW